MAKTLCLEEKSRDLSMAGVSVSGVSLGNAEYVTAEEVYSSLSGAQTRGNFGKCVWGQCNYSR